MKSRAFVNVRTTFSQQCDASELANSLRRSNQRVSVNGNRVASAQRDRGENS
jgi:hypothetical protein